MEPSGVDVHLVCGDCGHSTGGYHGAGVKEIQKWWIFNSGTRQRVRIDGISNSPFIHVRAKTRFYSRNHTKHYELTTLAEVTQAILQTKEANTTT